MKIFGAALIQQKYNVLWHVHVDALKLSKTRQPTLSSNICKDKKDSQANKPSNGKQTHKQINFLSDTEDISEPKFSNVNNFTRTHSVNIADTPS